MGNIKLSVKHEARGQESIGEARLGVDSKLRMLEGTARILSENYGVQVVFSDDGECKTSKERMTLPYDEAVDEALIMGLMGHETGHLKDTNFDVARTIAKMRTVKHRELLFNITNCLEDVRIEYIMETLYPGFKSMFRRMVPYIQERKEPLIQIEEMKREMVAAGNSEKEIAKAISEKNDKEIRELKVKLKQDYTDKMVEQLIKSEEKRRKEGRITELQMIMDLIYLRLRGYDDSFYPESTKVFVEDYLYEVAKETLNCKTTAEVLKVAEQVYEILTNEKGSQIEDDKKRQQMIQKMKKGNGSGNGPGGAGSGTQKSLSKEEANKANEELREQERKRREERMKKRQEGADVEDFVKNKQGEKGKGDKEGEGSCKFKVGQKVKSLDHDREGTVTFVGTDEKGNLKVEVDWN